MDRSPWLKVAALFCLLAVSTGRELKVKHADLVPVYNHSLATILVEYASAVYMSDLTALITWTCERCGGKIQEFEIIELIVDVQCCLQAFVGVAQDPNAIIIAFRGTQEHSVYDKSDLPDSWVVASRYCPVVGSLFIVLAFNVSLWKHMWTASQLLMLYWSLQNWIEDLFWKQLDLNYPGISDAMVHHGFYSAYHNTTIRSGVLNAVRKAKNFFGDLPIIATGHSMGGAMASFCALDLAVNHGEKKVQVLTFGQPRIGNSAFASYFHKHVPNAIRITHGHDMVPHLPPYYTYFPQRTYHHFPREVWLYNIGLGSLVYKVEKFCDDSGEDPSCSRSVSGNSISDHLEYFGVELCAETWGSCRIVMDRNVVGESVDVNGSFILSRDPSSSILKLRTQQTYGSYSSV